jgi:large repetitive protein
MGLVGNDPRAQWGNAMPRLLLVVLVAGVAAADFVPPADANHAVVTSWGAVPDDGIDDTAALQQAITQTVPDNNGGMWYNGRMLYLPAGTYDVSGTLSWKRWITIRGAGPGRTVIRLRDAAAGYGSGASTTTT